MQTIRTQGMGLVAFACVLGLSSMLQAEESPAERTVAILRQVQALAAAGQAEEADKLLALSVEEFRALVQAKPKEATAWIGLGSLQFMQERYDEAEVSLREAIRLDPKNSPAPTLLRTLLVKANRHDEAIPLFHQEIQLFPNDVKLRKDYALALTATKKLDEAEAQLREAILLDTRDSEAIRMLSLLLVERQKPDDAVATLKAGLELNPKDVELQRELVIVLYDAKVYSEAYAEQLKLRKLLPESILIEKWLILMASKLRRHDWAEKHIARLRELQVAQKEEQEAFVRDQFRIGNQRVEVTENFEIKGDPGFKFNFFVYDQNDHLQYKLLLLYSGEANEALRKQKLIKDSDQAVVFGKEKGESGNVRVFHYYRAVPSYETARIHAIEHIEADQKATQSPPAPSPPVAEHEPQPASK